MESAKKDPPTEDVTAAGLVKNDPQLKTINSQYSKAASDSVVESTVAKLKEMKHQATIVSSAKEIIALFDKIIPKGASLGFGYSSTFHELDLNSYFKNRKDLGTNYRELAVAADSKGDMGGGMEYRRQGGSADFFLTGLGAVAQTGELITGDASGTRLNGLLTAKNVIYVVGANKIVKDLNDARERLEKYQLPLESARIRIAYKSMGVTGSVLANEVVIRATHPFVPSRHHVIIVKGQSLGY